jgi:ribonuclease HI
MPHLHLFTDGSVNAQSKTGVGAFLLITDKEAPATSYSDKVMLKQFENTSSTQLELQTLLWALNEVVVWAVRKGEGKEVVLTIYTDSQNIIGLPDRRARLEHNDYISRNNKPLKNTELYRTFYHLVDGLNCTFVKVKGHTASSKKDQVDRLFSLVDQAARRGLRKGLDESSVDIECFSHEPKKAN